MADTNEPTPGTLPLPTPPMTPEEAEEHVDVVEHLPHATLYQRFVRSLDVGQVISAVLILTSLALILIPGDDLPKEIVSFGDLPSGVMQDGDGDAVLSLGILALILTPVIYVLAGLVTFLQERDKLFIGVTLVLVAILSTSVLLASI